MYISVILDKPSLFDKVEKYICTIYTIACTQYVINEEEEMKKNVQRGTIQWVKPGEYMCLTNNSMG